MDPLKLEDDDLDFEGDEVEQKKYFTFHTTRMIEAKVPMDREKYLKMSLIELTIHIAFLFIIIYIADNANYKLVYDITNSVTQLFVHYPISKNYKKVTFYNISTMYQVWEYLRNGLLSGLYWELEHEGKNLTDEEIGYILYRNRMLFAPVLRQIRVKSEECPGERICYKKYSPTNTMKTDLPGVYGTKFEAGDVLGFGMYHGRVGTYGGEGYQAVLPPIKRDALEIVNSMEMNEWLDRSTRALFVEVILYNKQLKNHCFVVMAFEFPATGGVFTSYHLVAVRIIRYYTNMDILDVIVDISFTMFIWFYAFVVVMEIYHFKAAYFTHFASISDFIVVLVSISNIGVGIYCTLLTRRLKSQTVASSTAITLGKMLHWTDSTTSIIFCLSFIKLFRYLSFNATLWSLSKTVYVCSADLTALMFLCASIYFTFAITGLLLFGYEFEEFAGLSNSLASMIRILLGDMDFYPFRNSFNFIGCFFSILFETIIFFIFMAGFLAVILSAYSDVSVLHQKQKFEMQMLEYIYRKLAQLFRKKYNEPPLISVQDWIKTMMDLGHPADAAEIIVSKYASQGITLDSFLTYPQQDELTYELEYYLKSAYMNEKLRSLQVGYDKAKNIHNFWTNPFVTPESPARGLTIISKMLHDITRAESLEQNERDAIYEDIKRE